MQLLFSHLCGCVQNQSVEDALENRCFYNDKKILEKFKERNSCFQLLRLLVFGRFKNELVR